MFFEERFLILLKIPGQEVCSVLTLSKSQGLDFCQHNTALLKLSIKMIKHFPDFTTKRLVILISGLFLLTSFVNAQIEVYTAYHADQHEVIYTQNSSDSSHTDTSSRSRFDLCLNLQQKESNGRRDDSL